MSSVSSADVYPNLPLPQNVSPRKRRKIDFTARKPLFNAVVNVQKKVVAGFLLDDSDDDEVNRETFDAFSGPAKPKSPHELPSHKVDSPGNVSQIKSNSLKMNSIGYHEPLLESIEMDCWIRCGSGKVIPARRKPKNRIPPYKQIIGAGSEATGGASLTQNTYYGVDIHDLIEEAMRSTTCPKLAISKSEPQVSGGPEHTLPIGERKSKPARTLMWTEKYRARKFTELVGDERTHRSVLKWLKTWDAMVFPVSRAAGKQKSFSEINDSECAHKKILLLAGAPGLGKTTLAHVCARQAGYEVHEINASDERNRDVVKGRIRDMVGTENVRQVGTTLSGKGRKVSRPVCVVVDEVDGVVGGASGSESGFIKALADLLVLDQKNATKAGSGSQVSNIHTKKKGDQFRLLRPLILICNDVYHPSLRLLRQGSMAEIIFVRKPPLNLVVSRVQQIFEQEGLCCDSDGARQLCEATWGVSSRKEDKAVGGTCDGDMRGILVIGEWVARKLRAEGVCSSSEFRLTKNWVQQNVVGDLSHGGVSARSLGRDNAKELCDRIFAQNASFPGNTAAAELSDGLWTARTTESVKRKAIDRLRELIASNSEEDRILTECFSIYPSLPYQDDNFLTKPSIIYDWLYFHDQVSSFVHGSQAWELAPYLPNALLAFHDIFACNAHNRYRDAASFAPQTEDLQNGTESNAFCGPRASYAAFESTKANHAALQHLQTQLSMPLHRTFRSAEAVAVELLPFFLRMLSPDVKPVIVGGSENGVASVRRGVEKDMIGRAVDAMIACGVKFERGRIDQGDRPRTGGGAGGASGWVYRMEPGLDALGVFETAEKGSQGAKTRFAIRQVLEQERKRETTRRELEARLKRMRGLPDDDSESQRGIRTQQNQVCKKLNAERTIVNKGSKVVQRKDFFGRPISPIGRVDKHFDTPEEAAENSHWPNELDSSEENTIWITYHEGFSNAVRKGITLKELLGFPMAI